MKKFLRSLLCMLLALSMVVCFAACDSKDKNDKDDEEETSSSAEDILKALYAEENAKDFSFDKEKAIFNGFGDDDVDQIYKILKKSNVKDTKEEEKDRMVTTYTKSYGDNYKFSYDLEDTDKIDKSERSEFEDDLNEYGEKLAKAVKNLNEDDIADALDINESEAQKLLKALKSFAETMEDAKVEEGLYLNYTRITKGSKVDDDDEGTMQVLAAYKVDGCWISVHTINLVDGYISMLNEIG